jgi:predicted ribosome quality control (RQC) complex YloA/Tae2 family protein
LPFDGIVTKCVVEELAAKLVGGRIEKVFQPEADEAVIGIRARSRNYRLVLSASANYPRIHLTETVKENPPAPPTFCMLLRKHLSGGKILRFEFNDYERIVGLIVEAANELGDISEKKLVIEIMGRYSNIILLNSENRIIDAVKHVDSGISSVREVMPARPYSLPPAQDKLSPAELDIGRLMEMAAASQLTLEKYLLDNIKGFSPLICRELCHRSGLEGRLPAAALAPDGRESLKRELAGVIRLITAGAFQPCIIYEDEGLTKPLDFHCLSISQYPFTKKMESISEALDTFYSLRDGQERLRQKKSDLTRVLSNAVERCGKKLAIQQDTLREVADRERLRLYGELITANIYRIPKNVRSATLSNFYSEQGENIEIPLDENLLPQENAQRYFRKYAKAKSTYTFTIRQLEDSRKELDYLESVLLLLENCSSAQEIEEVRLELAEQGYMVLKKKPAAKKQAGMSEPLRFKSSDGFDIFVGKNNRQNDRLTLKLASSNDIWLHTKNIPGSHVIIKKTAAGISETSLKEAAMLAAWYSKARMSSNVAVDFTAVKNVNKPSGAKPGMVIYVNYRTITVTPDEKTVKGLLQQ